jgi:hypothetical protein
MARNELDSLRVPIAMLIKISSELAHTAQEQTWVLTSAGGNVLTAKRRQSQDQWGDHDWINFSWNEGD